jgi:hypothetical protein
MPEAAAEDGAAGPKAPAAVRAGGGEASAALVGTPSAREDRPPASPPVPVWLGWLDRTLRA